MNDTCFGINNEGQLVFDYYHEDTDTLDGANVYNGQNSTLWCNFREAFADEIQETYQKLRGDGLITYDILEEQFITKGSDKWSESVFNEDGEFKYISMVKSDNDASNLPFARGDGEQHFRYFVENRLNYCDSKWYATDYANDYVSLRIYTPTTWAGVEPNANITVVPYSNMYAGVRYKANGTLYQERVEHGEEITFEAPDETFNDTETAIYGASQLSSLGDLAPLYCGTVNVANATKLTEIKIGDGTTGYANNNLKELSVGTNKLLKKIDIQNCPSFTSALGLAGCQNIEEIYAKGSGITGVELANSGYLKIIQLPATIANLTIKNQEYIEEFSMEGYGALKTLLVENCPAIDTLSILDNATNLERVRLTGVEWEYDDTSFLYELKARNLAGIDENGANTDKMWIDGTCHINSLSGREMAEIKAMYPYLTITYDNLVSQLIYVAPTMMSCSTDENGVLIFDENPTVDEGGVLILSDVFNPPVEEDGTLGVPTEQVWVEVYRETIINGGNGTCPVVSGKIETPDLHDTIQYDYTFSGGWSLSQGGDADESALLNVELDRIVYASFDKEIRKYTVNFYIDGVLKETYQTPYGGTATFAGSTAHPTDPDIFEFVEWKPSPANITGDTNCYAQYYDTREITDDWATIAANCNNGTATSKYAIGSYKPVEITYEDGTSETIPMEVIAHNHDELADGLFKWEQVESVLPFKPNGSLPIEYNSALHVFLGNSHYKYDGTTWTSDVSTLPYDLTNSKVVLYNNAIHVLGGTNGATSHYSWNGTTWTSVSTLPADFTYLNAVVCNNAIHIIGDNGHYKWNGSTWTSLTKPSINSLAQLIAITYNDEIYTLGASWGYGAKNMYKYDATNDAWIEVVALPRQCYMNFVVVYDGKIHVLGDSIHAHAYYTWDGSEWSEISFLPIGTIRGMGFVFKNEINIGSERFEHWKWSTTSWVQKDSPPRPLYSSNKVVEYNGMIHLFPDGNKHVTWDGNEYTQIGTIPNIYANTAGLCVYNNEIHIFGGQSNRKAHYKYDGSTWIEVDEMPYEMYGGQTVVYNDEIHILSGYWNKNHYKWTSSGYVQVGNTPDEQSLGGAVVYNGEIHLLGGSGYGMSTSHYKYNGTEWTKVGALPVQFINCVAVVHNNEIHLLGGNSTSYQLHYKWDGVEWTNVSTLPINYGYLTAFVYRAKMYIGMGNHSFCNMYVYQNPKATLTFFAKNLLKDNRILDDTMQVSCYKDSSLRTYLNNDFQTSLPTDLQNAIKEVNKYYGEGITNTIHSGAEKCWIPTDNELNTQYTNYSLQGEGEAYPVFTDNSSRMRCKTNGDYVMWWTSSTSINSGAGLFRTVSANGKLEAGANGHKFANNTNVAVCIGFCI